MTLSGTLSSKTVGASIDVMAQQCGQNAATKVTTVQTIAGGAFTAVVSPLANTTYTVKSKATTSNAVPVQGEKPLLRLTKAAAHRYSVRVLAAQSFAGKFASFQRYNAGLSRWVTVKPVALRANSTGVAPTVITSATFRSTIKARLKVRIIMTQAQVGTCYLAGVSNAILSSANTRPGSTTPRPRGLRGPRTVTRRDRPARARRASRPCRLAPERAESQALAHARRRRACARERAKRVTECARQDSNLRPLPPQGSALSPELRALGTEQCSRAHVRRRSRATIPGPRGWAFRQSA